MQKQQIISFNKWFDNYAASFYGDDDYVNANIKLKELHSKRVCNEMRILVDELKLSENQKNLAEAIALFHDIGRFEQFKKYRTYSDHRSIDHSKLGLETMTKKNILAGVEVKEKEVIEKAIEFHSALELPADLDGDTLLMAKLIRDADKLDIYYVVIEYYKKYEENPEGFRLEVELPNTPDFSAKVLYDLNAGRRIDYRNLKSWNDMKLCQLSWVYDINFNAALKRIKQQGYIEKIISFLPKQPQIDKAVKTIQIYIEKRIAQEI
jgi:hypothetical protein